MNSSTLQPILEAKNITKIFKSFEPIEILKNISLTLYPGKSIAIIGKSGSGKSTLLHILGTLDSPSSGTLTICGKQASSQSQKIRSDHIGFVFQSFHLLEDSTSIDNVLMPARILRKKTHSHSEPFLHAQQLLKFVGLSDKADTPVKLLSGGEKQRVALARAFCNNPDLLLVDEPTGNLDSTNASLVQKLLLEGCKKEGKSLILVTHDEDFASSCDEVFLLKEGSLERL